ncbi:MAG: peptidase [Rhodospirillaceae bacterium]|nr:peptidase [Rhodospirillaceae bacterium]
MSYCVGIIVDEGLALVSDSRTNAGIDRVSTFQKMFVYERPGDRLFGLLTAGNLSITQSVASLIHDNLNTGNPAKDLYAAPSMFEAARIVGAAVRNVHQVDGEALRQHDVDFNASFIFAGQIKGRNLRLFQIYAAGNFIEATRDTPYLQIGEIKYGKPILDRIITPGISLVDAAKCALISFDSTMRSNVSVGPPIDVMLYKRDALKVGLRVRLEERDDYLLTISRMWGGALQKAFYDTVPNPSWSV